MDLWVERVKNSVALQQAREIRTVLADLLKKEWVADIQAQLERADIVAGTVIAQLETSDPRLIDQGNLNSIGNALQDAHAHINSWAAGSGTEYLTVNAQSQLDNALAGLARLPRIDPPDAAAAVASMRQSVNGYRMAFNNGIKKLEDQVEEIRTNFDGELDTTRTDLQALDSEITAAKDSLEKVEAASQEVVTTQQTAFTKAETERSEAFSRLLLEKQNDFSDKVAQLTADNEAAILVSKKAVDANLKAAENAKKRIEKLVGIVGEEALVGEYSKNAKRDREAADRWRIVAVSAIGLAGGVAIWLIIAATWDDKINWYKVVAKIFAGVTLSGLAFYASRQSAEHRDAQRDAERMALQLAAVKPYLQDIAEAPKRDQLLVDIATKLFGREKKRKEKRFTLGKRDDPALVGQLLGFVQEVIKNNTKP